VNDVFAGIAKTCKRLSLLFLPARFWYRISLEAYQPTIEMWALQMLAQDPSARLYTRLPHAPSAAHGYYLVPLI